MEKIIHRPLKNIVINQKFAENKACVSTDGLNRYITCDGLNPPSGYRSLYGAEGHKGLDLMAYHGQEVYCVQKGVVSLIDTNPKSGLDVRVESEINGQTYRHIYEHLLGYQPKLGDVIETGQLIGWADNTGYSSGDHLHFQLEIKDGDEWVAIDPLPLMSDLFAKDVLWINHKLKYIQEQVAYLLDNLASRLRG